MNRRIKGCKYWWTVFVFGSNKCYYEIEFNNGVVDIWEMHDPFGVDCDRLAISIYCDIIGEYYK